MKFFDVNFHLEVVCLLLVCFGFKLTSWLIVPWSQPVPSSGDFSLLFLNKSILSMHKTFTKSWLHDSKESMHDILEIPHMPLHPPVHTVHKLVTGLFIKDPFFSLCWENVPSSTCDNWLSVSFTGYNSAPAINHNNINKCNASFWSMLSLSCWSLNRWAFTWSLESCMWF